MSYDIQVLCNFLLSITDANTPVVLTQEYWEMLRGDDWTMTLVAQTNLQD